MSTWRLIGRLAGSAGESQGSRARISEAGSQSPDVVVKAHAAEPDRAPGVLPVLPERSSVAASGPSPLSHERQDHVDRRRGDFSEAAHFLNRRNQGVDFHRSPTVEVLQH